MSIFQELTDDDIQQTQEQEVRKEGYPAPVQDGPLRWYEREMRCASRGCSSPTYTKLQGIPYCMAHALHKMNNMLIEKGIHS